MARGRKAVKKEQLRDSRDVRALSEFLREAVDVERAEATASTSQPGESSQKPVQASAAGELDKKKTAPANNRPIPGFRLKDASDGKPAALAQLEEIFGRTISTDVIGQVYSQMPDTSACVEALLGLTANTATPPSDNTHETGTEQRSMQNVQCGALETNLWDSLEPDCQLLVVDMLSAKHLAAAAPTCKSFARLAALRFENLDTIRCRKGCSFKSLPGMIASHKRASQISLNGMSADLRHIVHFESLSAALHRAMDNTGSSRVPLTHLQLQTCRALDIDALQLLLDAVPTLQSLDICRCVGIDDAAVKTLAQYEPGPADDAVHTVLESMQLEASGYAHTPGSQPLRGAPAPGGGSIFVRRHGRDVTFGSSIRVSPAVAALLQRHATSRGQQEADGEGPYLQDAETAEEGSISLQDTQQDLHLNASFHPDLLPAGLTGLMIKGSAATEAGVRALFHATARCAKTLRTLDVSECSGVKLWFLGSLGAGSALEVLRADGCHSIVNLNVKLPPDSKLRELSLKRCANLHNVQLEAPALQQFSASHSKMLGRLSLTAPPVQQLHATHCRNLQELSVVQTAETSVLDEINIEGCSSLPSGSMLALIGTSSRVRLCNLGSCRQLAQLMIPEHVCLEDLNVSATSVRMIVCGSPTLRTLVARRCLSLESVELATPTELCDVHNCVKLQRVHVQATGAQNARWRERTVNVGGCDALADGARRSLRTWATRLCTT